MWVPVPRNRLVAFTLAGALLTGVVAGALAAPIGGRTRSGGQADQAGTTTSDAPRQAAADAPTPNPNFTPAVRTQSGYEEREHEDDHDEHEAGEDDEQREDEAKEEGHEGDGEWEEE